MTILRHNFYRAKLSKVEMYFNFLDDYNIYGLCFSLQHIIFCLF